MNKQVLDKGYVRLVNSWGSELDIANSARVSYDKESKLREDGSLSLNDQKLVEFLVKHIYKFFNNLPIYTIHSIWTHPFPSIFASF